MCRKKRTQRRSSWAEFLGRIHQFLGRVLGPSSWAGYTRHHTLQAERKEHREPVLEPSSWAEFLGRIHQTSHITSRKKRTQRRSSWAEFLVRGNNWVYVIILFRFHIFQIFKYWQFSDSRTNLICKIFNIFKIFKSKKNILIFKYFKYFSLHKIFKIFKYLNIGSSRIPGPI